jgi:hypothetical protein
MKLKALIALTFLFFICLSALAQTDNRRCFQFRHTQASYVIDSLFVDPATIIATNRYGDTLKHTYDFAKRIIRFNQAPDNEPISLCFRLIDLPLSIPGRQIMQADTLISRVTLSQITPTLRREELFSMGGIEKTGVLSRGISFGNTQNVFVNSVLNLQMEGKLSENLNLRAAITDQRVPFQPEGNTLQIQEFDKVFIEVYNDNLSLTAGDVVFSNPSSEFLRYYKNVQGGMLRTKYSLGNGMSAETFAGASLAKGKFSSVLVDALEGVSGPYRLRGPEGERFIIIMANSERVFLDGRLLQRGFDYDYTIDYNLAEITFMPKVLITRYSRIRVDFEYADQNFSRSILAAGHRQSSQRWELSGNYYREMDNRNRPLLQTLSDTDKDLLSQIGNDLNLAVQESASVEPYNANQIQYVQIDTLLVNGQSFRIYKLVEQAAEIVYRVPFTEVGQGNGNYRILPGTRNGRAFQWVAPKNGMPSGNYEPISTLPVPGKREMLSMGAKYKASVFDQLYLEGAISNRDQNLFSELGNDENTGQALKFGLKSEGREWESIRKYKLSYFADFEYNSSHFSFIDRLRYIEFDRDWSLDLTRALIPGIEQIFNAGFKLEENAERSFLYQFSGRNREELVKGTQHRAALNERLGAFRLRTEGFLMNNSQANRDARWQRGIADISWRNAFLSPGYRIESDRNVVKSAGSDSVIFTAMNFGEHLLYIESGDTAKVKVRLSQSWREDLFPVAGELLADTRARNTSIDLAFRAENHDLRAVFTYREMENLQISGAEKWEETLLGRVDWLASFWDRNIRSELSLLSGDGRELRREFIFLQVATGEGTHTWRDENGDGIQDLNEFYEAINPDERNYIKVFVPTDEYTRAFSQQFNYRLNVSMPQSWRREGGFKGMISRFSNISSFSFDKKTTDSDLSSRFFPGIGEEEDVLSFRQVGRSSFFFNRSATKYGADFNVLQSKRRGLLTNGYEAFFNTEYRLNLRYNIQGEWNVLLGLIQGEKATESDFLSQRNFNISNRAFRPELVWQPGSQARISGAFMQTERENLLADGAERRASISEWTLDIRYMKVSKTTLASTFRFMNIDFAGNENTPAGYEMLQALRPGNNLTWNINLTQALISGLQLGLNYDGRKSPGRGMIHTGRMQISALF